MAKDKPSITREELEELKTRLATLESMLQELLKIKTPTSARKFRNITTMRLINTPG